MNTKEFKRKLTAILSADVEGYSRLMGEDEDATVRTLKAYRELIAEVIQNRRGRVVDSPGDNVLAEFGSVVDAVRCAVEIQGELKSRNAELPENRRMKFRIGVNLGDVIEDEERIYGDGVNIAARVEGLAEGEGICLSGSAYEQIKNKLTLGYEYLGEHAVKNIAEPVRVYRVLMETEAAGKVIGEERPKRWRWAAVGAVAVLIIVAGALAIWNFYLRPPYEPASTERMAFPLPDKPSIAVLPFVNMSGDPKQEYFSDGLTEEIISALSRVPKLFVIARNSTFTYKGKPVKVQQVSEELGVRYVLEGSVRKAEDRVRITAQLIDATTGRHLWSERYDRDLKDIFALQDEITKKIIIALQVKLTEGEQAYVTAKGTDDLDAYLKALEGWWYCVQTTKEGNRLARKLAEEAIALDPKYPFGYRVLGLSHLMDLWLGLSKSPRDSLMQAIEMAKKAIALDDSNAGSHALLGYCLTMARRHDEAIAEGKKAVSLAPNAAAVLQTYATILTYAGRREEAISLFREALRLNPKPPNHYYKHFGMALRDSGQYEEAIALQKKAIEQEPRDIIAYVVLASSCSLAGRDAEAQAAAEEILSINPNFSVARIQEASPHKDRAVAKRLGDALRKAGLPETPPLPLPDKPSIAVLPFVNMSGDPEQEYFSDGITEEIITAISKTPKLFVIARTSSFKYKGKEVDVRTVGRELGVRYVLEGSVRRSEDQLRITAQLVDAKTGNHLWAERYDRDLKDIFALQDEITMKILTALRVQLTEGEQARLHDRGAENLDSFLKVLQGLAYFNRFNKEDNVLARQIFEEANALDPNYARPYIHLAVIHILDVWFGSSKSPEDSLAQATQLARKALTLDDLDSYTHAILGHLYLVNRQHEKAIEEGEKAISLNPSSADAHALLGLTMNFADNEEEAILLLKKAIRFNPISPSWYLHNLGLAYWGTRRYEEAIEVLKKALQREPTNVMAQMILTITYSSFGREDKARAAATEVLRLDPKFSLEHVGKTSPFRNQADKDRFVGALRKAGLK
jgi:adenylate cyclase